MHTTEGVPAALAPGDEAAIRAIIARIEASWNAGDGAGFAASFSEDADYVIVDGQYVNGRATIAADHQQIFDTIYRGSRNSATVEAVRALASEVALARVAWHLRVPAGETEHEGRARNTLVLTKGAEGWRIAAFHNTPIVEPGMAGPGPSQP